jgi:Fe-S-cluster containining protein
MKNKTANPAPLHVVVMPQIATDEDSKLPDAIKTSLAAVRETRRLQYQAHGTDYTPCGWFDMESRQCRHHVHRPDVCREFEIGSEYCRNMRKDAGLSG